MSLNINKQVLLINLRFKLDTSCRLSKQDFFTYVAIHIFLLQCIDEHLHNRKYFSLLYHLHFTVITTKRKVRDSILL